MSRLARISVVTLSVIVFLYVGLGYVLGKTNDDKSYRSLGVFGEVLQHIQDDYVDQPNMAVVSNGALHGLLESLDPLSGYLSPREYADYLGRLKSGQHAEPGMTISKRYGYIVVVSVVPDGPAEKASLRSGEILEAISGFSTRDMSVGQANTLLMGAPGTVVKVDVVRRGKTAPQDISITRQVIGPQHIVAEVVGGDVAYVRLPAMDPLDVSELRDKLIQLDKQGVHKLVLDLRGCTRGEVPDGIAAAQLFLSSGKITSLKGQTIADKNFMAEADKDVWHAPVDVLISPSTSGAAEILAGAIEGNKRGDVVGERTYGSASEQKIIPLEDGGAVILTVAIYSTPDGKSIVDDGVAPTVEVHPQPLDFVANPAAETAAPLGPGQFPKAGDDPVYDKALELLKGGEAKKAA
ncbi:MAG TPA: S41 family peptidase [Candidatus Dormibacteraeota bacterium]|nr:S41 family peptidase [Candidatus Dormibacteraeota bacterium]